ncbi:site-specific DNA-methyltransferase [Candidatus Poribacteria bacterium]|nr:site-specific DNA-methyltransferase [Candidatus Poribacteria bacterium]
MKIDIGKQGKVIIADNMDKIWGIPSLDNESIALTFTSPPYWNYINYEGGNGVGNKESCYEDYLNSLGLLFSTIEKKTIIGGRMVVNVFNMKSRKSIEGKSFIYPLVHDTVNCAKKAGWIFFDEIIWDKRMGTTGALNGKVLFGSYPYPPTPKILDAIFENIIVFTKKGKRPKVCQEIKDKSRLTKEEWKDFTRGIWGIKTDSDPRHPATFPIELAERIVRIYSFVGDIVLDPFAGTGTTVIASELWNRKGIGFEISKAYQESIKERADKCLNRQLSLL